MSVNGKHHLSEVFFSALVGFSLLGFDFRIVPYTQDSSSVIMVFMKSGSLFVESSISCESWVYDTTLNQSLSLQWKSDESIKHYLTQMLLIINWRYGKNSRMHMKIQGRLMHVRFNEIHQVSAKKNKVRYFSNRVVYQYF